MTVEQAIAGAIGSVTALGGRVYPVGLVADDVPSPLAVYRFTSYELDQDLDGSTAFHRDSVQIDLWGPDYAQLSEIQLAVQEALAALVQVPLDGGHWLESVELGGRAADAVDTVRDELRRCVAATLIWS